MRSALEEMKAEREAMKSAIEEMEAEREAMASATQGLKAEREAIKAKQEECRKALEQVEKERAEALEQVVRERAEAAQLSEMLASAKERAQEAEDRARDLDQQVCAAKEAVAAEAARSAAAEKVVGKLEAELNEEKRLRKSMAAPTIPAEDQFKALEMLQTMRSQVKRMTELAEQQGCGKLLKGILRESKLQDLLDSPAWTCFDRLYEDAKRRHKKWKVTKVHLHLSGAPYEESPRSAHRLELLVFDGPAPSAHGSRCGTPDGDHGSDAGGLCVTGIGKSGLGRCAASPVSPGSPAWPRPVTWGALPKPELGAGIPSLRPQRSWTPDFTWSTTGSSVLAGHDATSECSTDHEARATRSLHRSSSAPSAPGPGRGASDTRWVTQKQMKWTDPGGLHPDTFYRARRKAWLTGDMRHPHKLGTTPPAC